MINWWIWNPPMKPYRLSNWNCPGLRLPHVRQHLKWFQTKKLGNMMKCCFQQRLTKTHGFSVVHLYRNFHSNGSSEWETCWNSMSLAETPHRIHSHFSCECHETSRAVFLVFTNLWTNSTNCWSTCLVTLHPSLPPRKHPELQTPKAEYHQRLWLKTHIRSADAPLKQQWQENNVSKDPS